MSNDAKLLFSYGTLRQPEVQRAVFGRTLAGTPDALSGFALDTTAIEDADVVATSGSVVHPILRRANRDAPEIHGVALEVDATDLSAADAYETAAYRRVVVTLSSERSAFVYVAADAD